MLAIKVILRKAILPAFFMINTVAAQKSNIYETTSGLVKFSSVAPLEIIGSSSNELIGFMDISKKSFSFSISMKSFQGFNSSLQKVHFNENYVESERYPQATFKGKIIEDVDLSKNGVYELRAKGLFNIHGVEQERIIKAQATVNNKTIKIDSKFFVLLSDHNIPIPKVVNQKLANSIKLEIHAILELR